MKNSLFDLLFLMNLNIFPRDFCVFFKGTMYDYLNCENGSLQRLLDDVRFVLNHSL